MRSGTAPVIVILLSWESHSGAAHVCVWARVYHVLSCFSHRNHNKGHGLKASLATVFCLLISSSSAHLGVFLRPCVSRTHEYNKHYSSTCISHLSHGPNWLAILWTHRLNSLNNSLPIFPIGSAALLTPCLIQQIWNLFQRQAKRFCCRFEWRDIRKQWIKKCRSFQRTQLSLTPPPHLLSSWKREALA